MNLSVVSASVHAGSVAEFSRSGGPGGQNVNKVNTKVTLRLPLSAVDGLNGAEMERLRAILASRINHEDEIVIAASEERSQLRNLERAYERMERLVCDAARLPRKRRPTKPSRAARQSRLDAKHHRGRVKADRLLARYPET
jgi:ribosome-associated protein